MKTEFSCCPITFVMACTSFNIAISLYIREFCNERLGLTNTVCLQSAAKAKINTCLEALLCAALSLVTRLVVVRLSYED